MVVGTPVTTGGVAMNGSAPRNCNVVAGNGLGVAGGMSEPSVILEVVFPIRMERGVSVRMVGSTTGGSGSILRGVVAMGSAGAAAGGMWMTMVERACRIPSQTHIAPTTPPTRTATHRLKLLFMTGATGEEQ